MAAPFQCCSIKLMSPFHAKFTILIISNHPDESSVSKLMNMIFKKNLYKLFPLRKKLKSANCIFCILDHHFLPLCFIDIQIIFSYFMQ